ncbi:MAG: GNAT family N-acetyltransferase [Candidatus Altiarchaeota archaeon]
MMNVRIRRAQADDLPGIRRLYEGFIQVGGDEEQWISAFNDIDSQSDTALLVAECDGKIAGTCILYKLPSFGHNLRSISYAEHVIVDENLRGMGVGRALMDECTRLAENAGSYKLIVPSGFNREKAHEFYEKLGFGKKGYVFQKEFSIK